MAKNKRYQNKVTCLAVGKAGVDKLAHDAAQELKKHNVACVSLWPGPVKTEKITELILGENN